MPNELLDLPIAGPERHFIQYAKDEEATAIVLLGEFYERGEITLTDLSCKCFELGKRSGMRKRPVVEIAEVRRVSWTNVILATWMTVIALVMWRNL